MTILFPDVSSYTPNVDPSKYPAVIARATLSSSYTDPTYATFKAKAAGSVFAAYHWLNHGNLQAQAKHCFNVVGPGTPVMIDAEDKAGNTGYNGPLTVDDLLGFAAEYRALGGTVSLAYLPFWYWSGAMGAPHRLDELQAAGLHLVSSNYPNAGYTSTGPGWATYYPGAPDPVQWQYTSTPIDMNAFRGTVQEYAALIGADMALTPDDVTLLLGTVVGSPSLGNKSYADFLKGGDDAAQLLRGSITEKLDGIVAALAAQQTVDVTALATAITQQLLAAGVPLTVDQITAAVKAGITGATIHSA